MQEANCEFRQGYHILPVAACLHAPFAALPVGFGWKPPPSLSRACSGTGRLAPAQGRGSAKPVARPPARSPVMKNSIEKPWLRLLVRGVLVVVIRARIVGHAGQGELDRTVQFLLAGRRIFIHRFAFALFARAG